MIGGGQGCSGCHEFMYVFACMKQAGRMGSRHLSSFSQAVAEGTKGGLLRLVESLHAFSHNNAWMCNSDVHD